MFRTIVVGADGSTTAASAIDFAARVARPSGARVVMVGAYRDSLAVSMALTVPSGDGVRAWLTERLEEIASRWRARGLDFVVRVEAGDAATLITDVARDLDADLIIVGNQGLSGRRRIFGGVPDRVARLAPCNVMIVDTRQPRRAPARGSKYPRLAAIGL